MKPLKPIDMRGRVFSVQAAASCASCMKRLKVTARRPVLPQHTVGVLEEATLPWIVLVYLVREWSPLTVRELSRRVQRVPAMISRFALTYVGQRDTKAEAWVRKVLGVPHAQEVRGKELARIIHEGSTASACLCCPHADRRIRGCDGQSRRPALRPTARVGLRASRLRVPVSLRVCALSRRTFMNNAG